MGSWAKIHIRQPGEFYDPLEYRLLMIDPKERIQELAEQIYELKANWPAHSAQPWMLQQLEELEEELDELKQISQDDPSD